MEFPDATNKVDIPGLYVIDDFVTSDEEKDIIKYFDSQQWIKLMNRRVQHYGYEFVYGANNVNKTKQIREMPSKESEILELVNNRINDLLKGFYINEKNEAMRIFDHIGNVVNEEIKYQDMKNYYETIGDFDQLT